MGFLACPPLYLYLFSSPIEFAKQEKKTLGVISSVNVNNRNGIKRDYFETDGKFVPL